MSTDQRRAPGHNRVWLLLFLFIAQCAFFTYIAWHRLVDGDEGFYLLASRLVLLPKRPYLDFFYTQAPLLPYVYGVWMKLFGVSWLSGKTFSALLTAGLGSLLCAEVLHHTRKWLAGVVAVVLFASSTPIFGFYPVVKTYSLAGLLLFAAYVLASRMSPGSSHWLGGAAGLLLGLSVSTRSYLVLTLPVLLWWILRNTEGIVRRARVLFFLGGFVAGIVPCLYLLAASPGVFLFNNLGYHALRSDSGLLGMWSEKLVAVLAVFLSRVEGNGIQTSLGFFVSLALLMSMGKERYAPWLAFQMGIAVGLISLLPTPVHPQYFCLCIPFLLVTAVCVVSDWMQELQSQRSKVLAVVGGVLLVVVYVSSSIRDFRRYLVTGDEVAGVEPGRADDMRLDHVLAVSRAIDEVVSLGEPVASFWPGFVFQTNATPFAGLENDFALPIASQISAEERQKYKVPSAADLEADFETHVPRVVVLRDHVSVPTNVEFRQKVRVMEDRFRAALLRDGYVRVRAVGDVSIYSAM